MDILPYIQANSDQLNADDLIGGPIVVRIEGVQQLSGDQPVQVCISGHMPWRPCKTTLRVLAAGWGTDTTEWVGRWVRLYRERGVKWAGREVGGVRIAAMSHMDGPLALTLAESRQSKSEHRVEVLEAPSAPQRAPAVNLDALLSDAGLSRDDVDAWRASRGRGPLDDLTDEQQAALAGWLAADPARLHVVRHVQGVPDVE